VPPSDLHTNLTKRVRGWMRRRATGAGIDYATEVYLAESYVADAVVIGSLQHRFWLEVTRSSIEEFRSLGSRDRVIAPEKLVMVFETKVSRSDFMCTFNGNSERNRSKPIGNLHYLVTPPGLKCSDHLPDWWGILEQSGNGLRQVRHARYGVIEEAYLWHAAFRVLLAQHRNPRCFICLGQTANELGEVEASSKEKSGVR
jgi:hypothetical protein